MNILVIGGGGREHALCWKLAQSPRCERLFCAPGNAGIAAVAECVPLDASDHAAVIDFARSNAIGLVVIGPEGPLVGGLADALRAAGIRAFGPSAAAAQLEGSKGFNKDLCARAGIPTAAYARFEQPHDAAAYVARQPLPVVIKADGLAAGKGVVIATSAAEAEAALAALSGPVVVEAFLTGPEVSFFVICDGTTALPLASAQDHKRAFDGDTGPNTGGMGAYSPAAVFTPALQAETMARIIAPTIAAMAAAGTPFTGVLYAGLMLTPTGPQLIEYNVRFGDPECQALMLRLESDLVELLVAAYDGTLGDVRPLWSDEAAVVVVMAANGYPGAVTEGGVIGGLDRVPATGATVFHAGTATDRDGRVVARGGRVLGIAARGGTVPEARARAYAGVARIEWPGGFCRTDIAARVGDERMSSRQQQFSGTGDVRAGLGFDEARLADWMAANVDGYRGPLTVTQFKGGQSNPTYKLTTPGQNYVLRRKPPGLLLKSAHAVDREYRVITALHAAGIPAPRTFGLCTDDAVIGTWFYVMDCVEGRIIWDVTFPDVSRADRPAYFDAMNATIAQLHGFDPAAIGLGDFGKPGNYFARQIARWSQQYLDDGDAGRFPDMDRLVEWLPANIPAGEETSVVHGDYRCDNMIFHPTEPRVLAVLDWELSTLGHPLADFSYHLMMYRMPTDTSAGLLGQDLAALNIPTEAEYTAAYCRRTGRDGIANLDFYVAYNMFRLAAIIHGIRGRVVRGTAASAHAKAMGETVGPLAALAWEQAQKAT